LVVLVVLAVVLEISPGVGGRGNACGWLASPLSRLFFALLGTLFSRPMPVVTHPAAFLVEVRLRLQIARRASSPQRCGRSGGDVLATIANGSVGAATCMYTNSR
jgi:hypothetical protein